jgi:hypothetical protein
MGAALPVVLYLPIMVEDRAIIVEGHRKYFLAGSY